MKNTGEAVNSDVLSLEENLHEVFDSATELLHLSALEKSKITMSGVALFIAAMPFVAGCNDAKEKSLTHLSIYVNKIRTLENARDYVPEAASSVYEDLAILSSFEGGDENIVNHGMLILALIMLESYKDRTFSDLERGVENPLNNGTWDYYILKASLLDDIKGFSCPELDSLVLSESGLLINHF